MTLRPERLMTVPCQVVRRIPGTPDAYGSDVMTETVTQSRCWYSSPTTDERNGVVLQFLTLYFGPDDVLDNVTRVEVEGIGSWEIDGVPLAHRSPRSGVLTHQTVKGRRAA